MRCLLDLASEPLVKHKEGVANEGVANDSTATDGSDDSDEITGCGPNETLPLNAIERVCKGSILGPILLPLLAVLSNDTVCDQTMSTIVLKYLVQLGRQCAEVS